MGERIRTERERQSYTQSEVAEYVGITTTSFSAIELGKHKPRPRTLRLIAEFLGVPIVQLTVGEDARK